MAGLTKPSSLIDHAPPNARLLFVHRFRGYFPRVNSRVGARNALKFLQNDIDALVPCWCDSHPTGEVGILCFGGSKGREPSGRQNIPVHYLPKISNRRTESSIHLWSRAMCDQTIFSALQLSKSPDMTLLIASELSFEAHSTPSAVRALVRVCFAVICCLKPGSVDWLPLARHQDHHGVSPERHRRAAISRRRPQSGLVRTVLLDECRLEGPSALLMDEVILPISWRIVDCPIAAPNIAGRKVRVGSRSAAPRYPQPFP